MDNLKDFEITLIIKYDTEAPNEDIAVENITRDILQQLEDGIELLDIADVEIREI